MGVAGESMPCLKGGDYDPGKVHCGELCYARDICHNSFPRYRGGIEAHGNMMWGCVLWVQWYTSDQSLNYSNSRTRGYG